MDASDVCLNCGASAFEEEDGLYFCTVCQTQRQGRTQEVLHDFESQNIESGEVSQKRKKKEISTGILWTTTEAFNHVLLSQVHALIDTQLVSNEFKQTVLTIWCCYLKYCEIAFVENGKNITPKLHPAARFRDVQITRNRCTQVPLYKNARSSSPKRRRLRFGNRVLQVHNLRDESMSDLSDEEVTRKYTSAPLRKTVSQRLFSTDIRRQIRDVVYGDYEAFSEFIETDTSDEDENLTTRYKKLKTLYNSGYLTNTKHIHSSSDCFIGILTLPKTIALLNLAMRLSNENIFTGDLLQLINKGCIPYFNALLTFPKDWKVLSTDCRTFVPTSSPTFQNIDTLTVKLANAIKINYLPSFNLIPLIERYVNDLNLPSDIVRIMHFQNVFETEIFSKMLTKKVSEMKRLPPLETIALMSIVLMLKRLFGLDGKCEYFLSRVAEKSSSNFIWKDWEQYSRLRLDCLKSYYLPLHNQRDVIRDIDSVVNFYTSVAEHWRPKNLLSMKKDETPLRTNLRKLFTTLGQKMQPSAQLLTQNSAQKLESHSVLHLSAATDSTCDRIHSDLQRKLSVNFKSKSVNFIEKYCVQYKPLKIGTLNHQTRNRRKVHWSSSFKFLLELSCVILQCDPTDLYITLNQLERMFLKHHWKPMKNKLYD